MKVKEKWFKRIEVDGKIYKKTDMPVIGGIAKCIKEEYHSTKYLTMGKYYRIGNYIYENETDDSTPSLMGDDGEPCGLHANFANKKFTYYS